MFKQLWQFVGRITGRLAARPRWRKEAAAVIADEMKAISGRRQALATGQPHELPPKPTPGDLDPVGLCLSGGGIRSAAFCLGALQALDAKVATALPAGRDARVLSFIDYLSTVSGGGYIGAAATARMRGRTARPFPFRSSLGEEEPPGLQGIRDRSNYLFPPREWALLTNLSIYLRGLAANVVIVAPWLLLLAALTLVLKPDLDRGGGLDGIPAAILNVALGWFGSQWTGTRLAYTVLVAAGLVVYLVLWALWRSRRSSDRHGEVRGGATKFGRRLLGVLIVLFFIELQPIVIALIADRPAQEDLLTRIGAALAAASAAVAWFRAPLLKLGETLMGWAGGWRATSKLLFALLGLPVPLLLWAAYLWLCVRAYAVDLDSGHFVAASDTAFLYAGLGVGFAVVSFLLSANANSLHRLYRERLNWTFFRSDGTSVPKLSDLDSKWAPYHLLGAAINLQGSRYANERGRNADFFMFSAGHVGSAATGYVTTSTFEDRVPDLDLGTAMAISGAAASPGMGSNTLRLLAPTLAFLNVRLGYWITNPKRFRRSGPTGLAARMWRWVSAAGAGSGRGPLARLGRRLLTRTHAYFLCEAFGLLDDEADEVYLTDGGHIDNLGLYELLRRRCRLIVLVDAEADPDLRFPSFVKVQRYARIDQGVRVSVPISEVRARSAATAAALAGDGAAAVMGGPHCAVGRISYDENPEHDGLLLYVKSSLTGDESDYVLDYARRNPTFPHESTLDQLFSEEQFEVYRALGFHALYGALDGQDCMPVAMKPEPAECADPDTGRQPPLPPPPLLKISDPADAAMKRLRAGLGLA
jgi:predicted acylesterase/phospholipase RssA